MKHELRSITALLLAPLVAVTSLDGAVADRQDFQIPGRVYLTGWLGTRIALFAVPFKQGQTMLCGTFLDDQGKEICGAYYVSVRYLANVP